MEIQHVLCQPSWETVLERTRGPTRRFFCNHGSYSIAMSLSYKEKSAMVLHRFLRPPSENPSGLERAARKAFCCDALTRSTGRRVHVVLNQITSLVVQAFANKDEVVIEMKRHDMFVEIGGYEPVAYEFRVIQPIDQSF